MQRFTHTMPLCSQTFSTFANAGFSQSFTLCDLLHEFFFLHHSTLYFDNATQQSQFQHFSGVWFCRNPFSLCHAWPFCLRQNLWKMVGWTSPAQAQPLPSCDPPLSRRGWEDYFPVQLTAPPSQTVPPLFLYNIASSANAWVTLYSAQTSSRNWSLG